LTRDIWIYDIKKDSYRQITSDRNENRNPYFSADGKFMFYTNETGSDLNIYKRALNGNGETRLTDFKDFPVRALSVSDKDQMAFTWKGDIYTMSENSAPKKLSIRVLTNSGFNTITHKK